jgi:hypothetical protein
MDVNFMTEGLIDQLDAADDAALDALTFGVVAMSEDGTVTCYNMEESRLSAWREKTSLGGISSPRWRHAPTTF